MPRIKSPEERENLLEFLKQMQESNPDYQHQFTIRIPVRFAIQLVEAAEREGEQVPEQVRSIIKSYYTGEVVHLEETLALILAEVAQELGKEPSAALRSIMVDFAVKLLKDQQRRNHKAT